MQLTHLLPEKNLPAFHFFFPLVILNCNEEEKFLENGKSTVSGNLHSVWFCSAEASIKKKKKHLPFFKFSLKNTSKVIQFLGTTCFPPNRRGG